MRVIRGLRWYVLGLIFLATCINYVDRSSVGLLFTQFGPETGISLAQYGWVGAILLLAYTLSQSVSGRIFDRFGCRIGFAVSISVWCGAAMAHSLIAGVGSFALCSFFLGLGEAGNWPGAAKVVAEWFPAQERALGMAVFNGGAAMGGVVAPLLVAAWLSPIMGWRTTFLVVGLAGFLWLAVWLVVYRPVEQHPCLSRIERDYIGAKSPAAGAPVRVIRLRVLFSERKAWAILLARFFVDPIWWLYMLWLPIYLKDVHHLDLRQIGLFQWFPFLAAAVGSLFGGWLSGALVGRGWSLNAARKTAMGAAACLMPVGILAAHAHTPLTALGLISVVLFGFQMWISNVQTLPGDCFPASAVGTVAGLGGSAAGLSSLFFNLGTGWMVSSFGYGAVLTAAGVLAPIGALILFLTIGVIGPVASPGLLHDPTFHPKEKTQS